MPLQIRLGAKFAEVTDAPRSSFNVNELQLLRYSHMLPKEAVGQIKIVEISVRSVDKRHSCYSLTSVVCEVLEFSVCSGLCCFIDVTVAHKSCCTWL